MKANTTKDIPNLDFLRSVAVLLVFARHIVSESSLEHHRPWWFQPQVLGIMGVFLFFVHTSLVLMFSLERTWRPGATALNALSFYARRFFRIYPLSMFVVAVIAFILIPFFGAKQLDFSVLDLPGTISNMFLVQNITHHDNILGVLWSLPLEVQMYLTLPFLFMLARNRGVNWLYATWGLAVCFAILSVYLHFSYNLLKYVPCFIPGIIAYKLWNSEKRLPFIVLPIAIFLLASYYMVAYGRFGTRGETGLGYPICLSIGLLLPFLRQMKSEMLAKVAKAIATYSYGIYLTHSIWNRFVFGFFPDVPFIVKLVIAATLTWCTSVVLYYLLEKPFISIGSFFAKRVQKLQLGFTGIIH